MSPPKLYYIPPSSPVRAVQMCAKAINLQLEEKLVDLFKKEHLTTEFLKINPQHTVPTLDDNGFILWDSHAILAYLINKYAPDSDLYPKDAQKRAIIDQRLHYDSNILWPHSVCIFKPIIWEGRKDVPDEFRDVLLEDYKLLEGLLEKSKFIAGDSVTIADFSIISTISSTDVLIPVDAKKFPRLSGWMKEMSKLPYYDANQKGQDLFKNLLQEKLNA